MTVLAAFLGELTDTQKALTALAGAASFGAVIALAFVGFVTLPARVDAIEAVATETAAWRQQHTREFSALLCILTLEDPTDRNAQIRECGV